MYELLGEKTAADKEKPTKKKEKKEKPAKVEVIGGFIDFFFSVVYIVILILHFCGLSLGKESCGGNYRRAI